MTQKGGNPAPRRRFVKRIAGQVAHDFPTGGDFSKRREIVLIELAEQEAVGFKAFSKCHRAYFVSSNISRPMSMRRISDVPAPIS